MPRKRNLLDRGQDREGYGAHNVQRGGVEPGNDDGSIFRRSGFGSTLDDSLADDGRQLKRQSVEADIEIEPGLNAEQRLALK